MPLVSHSLLLLECQPSLQHLEEAVTYVFNITGQSGIWKICRISIPSASVLRRLGEGLMGAQNNCFLMEQGLAKRVGEQEMGVLRAPSAQLAASLAEEDGAIPAHEHMSQGLRCCSPPPGDPALPRTSSACCPKRASAAGPGPNLRCQCSGGSTSAAWLGLWSLLTFCRAPRRRPRRTQLHPWAWILLSQAANSPWLLPKPALHLSSP